jgi:hypothetical protein
MTNTLNNKINHLFLKWNELDKEVDEMRTNHYDIITLNVGGKIFQTK